MTADMLRKELDAMYHKADSQEYRRAITDIIPMVDMVTSYEAMVRKSIIGKSNELYMKAMKATSRRDYDDYMTMSLAVGAILVYFDDKDG